MRLIPTVSVFIAVSLIGANVASAQGVDAFFGLSTARATSSGVPIDTFGTGTPLTTPALDGVFLKFGGDIMFTPHLGAGVEASIRATQGDYAGLKYKPSFYDFNAIWRPVAAGSRIVPEFQAGIGGVNLKYYYSQQFCDQFAGCSTSNSFLESSNHFQTHFSAGVNFYVTNSVFVRPQVDLHWVHNFFQFGTDWVPEYGASVGYTFGRR
jgi:hypothetical protein